MIAEPLDDAHDLSGFDCANEELNRWLRESARHAQRARTCRTFVLRSGTLAVIGYYSLAAHLITRVSLGSIGRGGPDQIPAVLLARLALHKDWQGQGRGAQLLAEALERAVTAGESVGARFVVVDAIDERACAFYARYGFRAIPGNPRRLVRKMSNIARDLAAE